MTSGVPQGSILGLIMFLVYINDIPDYISTNSTIVVFADDSKLFQAIDHPSADKLLQQDCNCFYTTGVKVGIKVPSLRMCSEEQLNSS